MKGILISSATRCADSWKAVTRAGCRVPAYFQPPHMQVNG